jgi:hypothetical protein
MYTILTTCPPYGSRNVGDKLIEQRTKELVRQEKGPARFLTVFREQPLDDRLAEINASRALLMPAFPIRDTPMHPGTYRLVDDLDRIRVQMVPIGANWNVYPGDAESRRDVCYSEQTAAFLRRVADQVDQISCREYYVCRVLQKHGIHNTVMTGDPAFYHLASLGKPMARPAAVGRLAFSPPLSAFYVDQAELVLETLAGLFPEAERFCAMHLADADTSPDDQAENSAAMSPAVAEKNRRVRQKAAQLGFECLDLAGDPDGLAIYDTCDLHVGYECHAHLYFLSHRLPSLLIAEDARGVGFNYTLGLGGITGFVRAQRGLGHLQKRHTSGYCTSLRELVLAPPRADLPEVVEEILQEELDSGFRRYVGLADRLDELYEQKMRPFLQSLP